MKTFFREILKQGKDIKWFANEMGVSIQTVYSWKLGKGRPRNHNMHKMAKLLKIDIDKIIDDFYEGK